MTAGVTSQTVRSEATAAPARLASADKPQPLLERVHALGVRHHVVDGVVERERRAPARRLLQGAGVRLALAEFLEAVVVCLLVRHVLDRRAGAGPGDYAPG